jgi:hypothetical protein
MSHVTEELVRERIEEIENIFFWYYWRHRSHFVLAIRLLGGSPYDLLSYTICRLLVRLKRGPIEGELPNVVIKATRFAAGEVVSHRRGANSKECNKVRFVNRDVSLLTNMGFRAVPPPDYDYLDLDTVFEALDELPL